jgi:hypothetical protein
MTVASESLPLGDRIRSFRERLSSLIPTRVLGRDIDRRTPIGCAVAIVIGLILLWTAHFDAGRPDVFYLADAFLKGKTWLDRPLGPDDVIPLHGHYYVPFAPFPSILFMPLMLFISPVTAHSWEPIINSTLAAVDAALMWWLAARIGVERVRDRLWLTILLVLGTDIWWVVVRGGVWHTGHLVATMLTLAALIECFGKRRPFLIGLLAGAAFLTRAPVIFALVFYAYVVIRDRDLRTAAGRKQAFFDLFELGSGVLPSFVFFLWYNQVRFGSPFESGYELATLPGWLAALRDQGLFSLSHVPRNWDFFILKGPVYYDQYPFFKPNSIGNSILFTSPALLLALFAGWRKAVSWALAAAFVLILLPNLLYYGGGWYQFGFRYALDAVPFAMALCALALTRRSAGIFWWLVLAFSVYVNFAGADFWAYHGF